MHRWILSCVAVAALQAGCASVQVERGKDVAKAGIAYSDATVAVIDLAMDAVVDASSKRRLPEGARPAVGAAAEEREKELAEIDAELVINVRQYAALKRSVNALGSYFIGLQELSSATPGDAVETSLQGLADRVNGVSTALGGEARLDDNRKSAIAGLGKLVVKQAHGVAVAQALERDASVIGRALALQQIALQQAASEMKVGAAEEAVRFHRERVVKPYLAGGVGQAWVDDRRTYIKAVALGNASVALKDAAEASLLMEDVWRRILSGETTSKEFALVLKDLNEALDAATALKKAF